MTGAGEDSVGLTARWDLAKLATWLAVVVLFAIFIFFIARIQLGVEFSDREVTESKRDRISSEVFDNLIYHVAFIGLILVLGAVGYVLFQGGGRERSITSEPGELVS
jgi:hypothetical protein